MNEQNITSISKSNVCDIKDQLNNPAVRAIMAASAFDTPPEAMDYKAAEFRRHESW